MSYNPLSEYDVLSGAMSATSDPSLYTLNPLSLSEVSFHTKFTVSLVKESTDRLFGEVGGVWSVVIYTTLE